MSSAQKVPQAEKALKAQKASVLDSDRLWRVLMALTPAMVYIAGRLLGMTVLAWLAKAREKDFGASLAAWDGLHFIAIAEHGYTWSMTATNEASPAFFPGLPRLMALVSALLGSTERTAGLWISAVAGVVAAYGLMKLAEFVPGLDRAGALLLVAVFSLAPMSIVLSMAYTEALFCALAIWSLVFLLRGQWLVAGTLSLFAGLVRPTGFALAGAVMIAALIAILKQRATWQTWVGAALAPLGFLGWIGYVGYRFSDPAAWFTIQNLGWHSSFDFGAGTLDFAYRTLKDAPALLDVVTLALLVAAVVLLVLSIRQRQPYELLIYSALVAFQVLGSDGIMNSKGRLLIPAFTLLIPLAVFLNRERRTNAVLGLILVGLMSCWYSAYAVLIYPYAI